ncbi:MAG: sarcosine oxidase subunit alpha [Sulfobacillus acidophilus]|uniref:Sarcosine oxidase subunit alpha n=1 Tax=Sulfobacillus acidophilus TaxID=53633 RepID=A0A2T2WL60_9FIRM|nr:MAG: sarcosine oxidase subunit alpha [Sulfobacillus acidophilus]
MTGRLHGIGSAERQSPTVQFYLDGKIVTGMVGEPVAMSLWALGERTLGWNEESGEPRGVFCNIGHCFECRMTIAGQPDQRACLYPVREGLEVRRQPRPSALTIVDGMTRL